MSTGIILKWPM